MKTFFTLSGPTPSAGWALNILYPSFHSSSRTLMPVLAELAAKSPRLKATEASTLFLTPGLRAASSAAASSMAPPARASLFLEAGEKAKRQSAPTNSPRYAPLVCVSSTAAKVRAAESRRG